MSAGNVVEACATWSRALDARQDGIYVCRARQCVVEMRQLLAPYRRRDIPVAAGLERGAADCLRTVD